MKPINLTNILYSQTLRENVTRSRKQRHYPSSACAIVDNTFYGKCRRATWYDWNGIKITDPIDAPALFKMSVGNLIHDHLSGILNRALADLGFNIEDLQGEGLGEEVALLWNVPELEYPVSGRMDKRLIRPDDGLRLVIEWKSIYGRGADFVKRDGPKEDNLLQCAMYLEQDVYPVDAVALMYATRDSGYVFGYWLTKNGQGMQIDHMGSTKVTFTPLGWAGVLRGLVSLEAGLRFDEPPDRDYGLKDWQCSYCSYKSLCWGSK